MAEGQRGAAAAEERNLGFDALYRRFFKPVHRYLAAALGDDAADDATQQLFLKLFERPSMYKQREQPFRAWLFRVVRNHAIDERRKLSRAPLLDPVALERQRDREAAEMASSGAGGDYDLADCVSRLPEKQRSVLRLRYVWDLTPAETGEALHMTADSVRHAQMRALRSLAGELAARS